MTRPRSTTGVMKQQPIPAKRRGWLRAFVEVEHLRFVAMLFLILFGWGFFFSMGTAGAGERRVKELLLVLVKMGYIAFLWSAVLFGIWAAYQEIRGLHNWHRVQEERLDAVERKHPYLPSLRQIVIAIILVFTLPFFIWSVAAQTSVAVGAGSETLEPYVYTEQRAWQIANDDIDDDWLGAGWSKRKKITIDRTYVDSDLTNFPVMIKFANDTSIGTVARSDGYDIRFTSNNGQTLLKYERQSFVVGHGSGSGIFWVKVPTVTSASNTDLYIYYGNAGAADGQDKNNVWDANFRGVWHLEEAGDTVGYDYLDSTSNNNHLQGGAVATTTAPTRSLGISGYNQTFNGTSTLLAASSSILDNSDFTISAFTNHNGNTNNWEQIGSTWTGAGAQRNMVLGYDAAELTFATGQRPYVQSYKTVGGGYGRIDSAPAQSMNTNLYLAGKFVASSNVASMDINGVAQSLSNNYIPGSPPTTAPGSFTIGAGSAGWGFFNGTIDELRLSDTVRSTAWNKFEYRNMVESDNEISFASTESASISGRVFSDEGTTPLATKTVAVSINGAAAAGTAVTNANGGFTVSNLTINAGDVVTLYIDNASEDAVTVTLGSGASMTGMHLYQNHLIVRSDNGSASITNVNLNTANNNADTDITAIYDVNGSNVLQLAADKELYVWTGDTYTPGAAVRGHDLEVKGTMALSSNTLTLTGSLLADAGTLTTSGDIMLSARTSSETLSLGSNAVQNLTIQSDKPEANLVGWWKFDNNANDSSGNGWTGTVSGPTYTTTAAKLRYANTHSLSFDGVDDIVTTTNTNMYQRLTLSAWVKPQVSSHMSEIISKRSYCATAVNDFPVALTVGAAATAATFFIDSGGDFSVDAAVNSVAFTPNQWHHIAATYDGSAIRIYADGIGTSTNTSITIATGSRAWAIGRAVSEQVGCGLNGSSTLGLIDDARIYSRALSQNEINRLAMGSPYGTDSTAQYTLGSSLDVNGSLNLLNGKLIPGSNTITVAGNWANYTGTGFVKGTSNVSFDGSGAQTMSGVTIFNTLTATTSTARTLNIDYTGRQSVSGSLVLNGAVGNLLSLRSTVTGTAAPLSLDVDATQNANDVRYLDVKDITAAAGQALACFTSTEGCINSGNNTNWVFVTPSSLSGRAFSDEGTAALASKTVAVSINGAAAAGTTSTNSNGAFTVSNLNITAGDVVSVYLDNNTEKAVSVTLGSGSNMTGIHLYQNHLIVRSDSGSTALTNAHLNTANNNADTDITAIYDVNGSNVLQLAADKELYVWAGKTYAPGAAVRGHDLEVKGTMTLASNTLTLTGSLIANAGTFTTSAGIVLNSRATNETLSVGANSVQNLTIGAYDNGLLAYWPMDDESATFVKDATGNGYNGTVAGTRTNSTNLPYTRFYNKYSFQTSGGGGYFSSPALNGATTNLTLALWVRSEQASQAGMMYRVGGSAGTNGYGIYQGGGCGVTPAQTAMIVFGNVGCEVTGYSIPTNQWVHLALSRDSSTWRLRANGTSVWTSTTNPIAPTGTNAIGGNFVGKTDDIRYYTRELTAAEVTNLANGYDVDGASAMYTLGAALDVNGNLQLIRGGIDVSGSNYPLTLAGNWENRTATGFVKRAGTVTFDGSSTQTISGSTIFHNLSATTSTARTLYLEPINSVQSVSGALTLRGIAGNLLSIRSTTNATAARLYLDGDAGTQTIDYLDVKDANATGGQALSCPYAAGCLNSGNNTNWSFGVGHTVTGRLYSDEGMVPLGLKTVAMSLAGAAAIDTTTTDVLGQFTLSGAAIPAGTVVTVYVDNHSEDAVTVLLGSGSNMSGINLYQNHLIVRSEDGSNAITNVHLNTANNNGDTDITAIYDVNGSNVLQLAADKELYVWTGDTYSPGAAVRTHDLEVKGTLQMSANTLTVSGSLIANAGTFTTSSGVILGGSATTETLTMGANTFQNLSLGRYDAGISTTGLAAYWKLNEGTGTTSADSSGNGRTLSFFNSPSWTASAPTLKYANPYALSFAGNTAYAAASAVMSSISGTFTVSFWANPNATRTSTSEATSGISGTSGQRYAMYPDQGDSFGVGHAGAGISVGTNGVSVFEHASSYLPSLLVHSATVSGWTQVTVVYSSNRPTLYLNGTSVRTGLQSTKTVHPPRVLGDAATGYGPYSGSVDDVRVYSRALTAAEITLLGSGYGSPFLLSSTYTLGSALDVDGSLTINSGSVLDVSGSNYNVNVATDFVNKYGTAGFVKRSGTVTLDGTNQTVSGAVIFHNLTKTVSTARTLSISPDGAKSVSGALTLRGIAGNLLSIRSTVNGTAAGLFLDGDAGTQTIDYLDVKDANASGGQTLTCLTSGEGCVNSNNNTNWSFTQTYSLSGRAFSDEGTTPLASKTVAVSINGAAASGTASTDSNGAFTVSNLAMNGSSILSIYLDNNTEKAVTVTIGSGSSMTGIHLYQNHLIVRSDSGSVALTNTHLNTANNNADTDITAIYDVNGSNVLQVAADKELYVWAGKTYTPGAAVRGHDLEVKGTMTLASNTLTLTGSLLANAGTFTTSAGITLGSLSSSAETLSLGTNSVQNLTMNNGLVGYWKFDEGVGSVAKDSTGNALNGTAVNTVWSSSVPNTKFYDPKSLSFNGSTSYVNIPASSLLDVQRHAISAWAYSTNFAQNGFIFEKTTNGSVNTQYSCFFASATTNIIYRTYNGSSVINDLSVTLATAGVNNSAWNHIVCTYDGAFKRIFVNGVQVASAAYTQTLITNAAGAARIGAYLDASPSYFFNGLLDDVRVYNRALSSTEVSRLASAYADTGSGSYTLGADLDINGSFVNLTSNLSASSYTTTVAGNWANYGTFTKGTSTVSFDGSSTQTMSGSAVFHNLLATTSTARTLYIDHTAHQSASGSLTLRGVSGNKLSLRSTRTGSGARVDLEDSASQLSTDFAQLDVQDANASGGQALVCMTSAEGCTDSGNNMNWTFAQTYSLSGRVFSDEGTTALASKTVAASINGAAAAGTTSTNSNGAFTLSNLTMAAGDVLTLYLDGNTEKAVTVTLGSGSNMTGIHLYQNRLIVRSDDPTPTALTNVHLNTANNNADTDITAIYDVNGSNVLQLAADKELYVWAGDTYTPGAAVRGHDLEVKGTMTLAANTLTLTGSLLANAGTFTTSGDITLGSISSSAETLSLGGNSIQNLTINNGLVGYWKFDEGVGAVAKDVSGNAYNGTLANGPLWASSGLNTRMTFYNPSALNFDGVNDEVTTSFSASSSGGPSGTAKYSIAAWIKSDITSMDKGIAGWWDGSSGLFIQSGNSLAANGEGLVVLASSGNDFGGVLTDIDGGWHHVTLVYDGSLSGNANRLKLFVDGASTTLTFNAGANIPASLGSISSTFVVGDVGSIGRQWDGLIDDVRAYSRALSTTEITNLYNGNQSSGVGVYALGSALDVNGNLNIQSGGIDASSQTVTVAGNWANHGTFTKGTSTVTLDGSGNQTMSGSSVFHALTAITSTARTLYIDHTARQSTSGSLTLRGVSGNRLSLRSTRTGSGARVDLEDSASQLSTDFAQLDVKDMNASGGQTLTCLISSEGCTDSGNNTNWIFGSSFSGRAFSDEGTTPLASKTVAISLNGNAAAGTTTTNSAGAYTITGLSMTGGTIISVYLDGNTEKAVTVTLGSGSNMTGIHLYQNHLIVRSDSGSVAVTNAQLKVAAANADTDISALYAVNASNILQVAADKELYVWAGKTFAPGARVRTHDLEVKGTMNMGTNGLTASGSLVANAGTFTTSTGITLIPRSSSETLTFGANSVQNITFGGNSTGVSTSGLLAHWKFDEGTSSTVADSTGHGYTGTLVNSPTWSATVPSVQFADPYSVDFNGSSQSMTVAGTQVFADTGAPFSFSAWVSLDAYTGTYPTIASLKTNTSSTFDIGLSNGASYLGVWFGSASSWTTMRTNTAANTFTSGWHLVTVTYNGNGPTSSSNFAAYVDATPATIAAAGTFTARTNENRIGAAGGPTLYFDGKIDDARIYSRALSSSDVSLLAQGYGSSQTFAGTYTLGSSLDVNGTLTITSGSILDVSASNYALTLSGSFINKAGNTGFTKRSGTVTLDGGNQTLSGSTIFNNLTKTVSAARTLSISNDGIKSVSGALTLRGIAGNLLSIRSTVNGSAARLLLDGDSGTQTIDHLDVQDIDVSSGQTLVCYIASEGCIDSGNNTFWTFSSPATVAIDSSLNPSTFGDAVTFTASLTPSLATGTLTFKDGSLTIDTVTIGHGSGSVTTSALSGGSHDITVEYSGDSQYGPDTSDILVQNVDQADSTTSVDTSVNPSTFGDSVTFTASVTPSTATGTFTFKDGLTTIGTANVGHGSGSYSTSALAVADHSITVVYSGDNDYLTSTSDTLNQTVNRAGSSIVLVSGTNPSTYGNSVTLTGTVTPSTATGTLTFKDGSTTIGTATLGHGSGSVAVSSLSGGSHSLTVIYAGNGNYTGNTSNTVTQTVNKATSSSNVASSLNPSTFGASVIFTATVTPSTATGTFTFKDGSTTIGTATVGHGSGSMSTSALIVGDHDITVVYGGNNNYFTSTSSILTQTVNRASSSVALVSSLNPSTYGFDVTLTATVTPSTATGTLTFKDGSTTIGTATLGHASGSVAISSLSGGSHSLTAVYSGNTNYTGSTSNTVTQTIDKAGTITSVVSVTNPSIYTQSTTFRASVIPSTATGTLTFKDGSTTLGIVTIGHGSGSYATDALTVGDHDITAVYSGNNDYLTSTSSIVTHTVTRTSSSVVLASSLNPSTYGVSVTLTGTVSPSSATGTLTFKDGSTTVGTATIGHGSGSTAVASLSGGSHSLTVEYGGNGEYTGSTSNTVTQTVNKANSTSALTSEENPSLYGTTVTLTASVTPSTGTGVFTFKDGSTTIGTGTIGHGSGSYTTSALAVGAHTITAVYSGNNNYLTSTSSALTQHITGVVKGVLWNDENGDGVKDEDEETGLDAVSVGLAGLTSTGGTVDLTETTNTAGQFAFSGTYVSDDDGYTVTVNDGDTPDGYLKTRSNSSGSVMIGADGIVNVLFGYVQPSTLSGTVFVDTDEDGVQDAGEITVFSGLNVTLSGTTASGAALNRSMVTSSTGSYIFRDLPPTATFYVLVVTPPDDYHTTTTSSRSVAIPVGSTHEQEYFGYVADPTDEEEEEEPAPESSTGGDTGEPADNGGCRGSCGGSITIEIPVVPVGTPSSPEKTPLPPDETDAPSSPTSTPTETKDDRDQTSPADRLRQRIEQRIANDETPFVFDERVAEEQPIQEVQYNSALAKFESVVIHPGLSSAGWTVDRLADAADLAVSALSRMGAFATDVGVKALHAGNEATKYVFGETMEDTVAIRLYVRDIAAGMAENGGSFARNAATVAVNVTTFTTDHFIAFLQTASDAMHTMSRATEYAFNGIGGITEMSLGRAGREGASFVHLIAWKIKPTEDLAKHPVEAPIQPPLAYNTELEYRNNQLILAQLHVQVLDAAGEPYANTPVILFSVPKVSVTNEHGVVTFTDIPAGEHSLEIHRQDGVVERRKLAFELPSTFDPEGFADPIQVSMPLIRVTVDDSTLHGAGAAPSWNIFIAFAVGVLVMNAAGFWWMMHFLNGRRAPLPYTRRL